MHEFRDGHPAEWADLTGKLVDALRHLRQRHASLRGKATEVDHRQLIHHDARPVERRHETRVAHRRDEIEQPERILRIRLIEETVTLDPANRDVRLDQRLLRRVATVVQPVEDGDVVVCLAGLDRFRNEPRNRGDLGGVVRAGDAGGPETGVRADGQLAGGGISEEEVGGNHDRVGRAMVLMELMAFRTVIAFEPGEHLLRPGVSPLEDRLVRVRDGKYAGKLAFIHGERWAQSADQLILLARDILELIDEHKVKSPLDRFRDLVDGEQPQSLEDHVVEIERPALPQHIAVARIDRREHIRVSNRLPGGVRDAGLQPGSLSHADRVAHTTRGECTAPVKDQPELGRRLLDHGDLLALVVHAVRLARAHSVGIPIEQPRADMMKGAGQHAAMSEIAQAIT